MGGPEKIMNTNGAGDGALAALLHDITANNYHRNNVPNSSKHKCKWLTYSSLAQVCKYANRVSYQVLNQHSPRLTRGLPEREDSPKRRTGIGSASLSRRGEGSTSAGDHFAGRWRFQKPQHGAGNFPFAHHHLIGSAIDNVVHFVIIMGAGDNLDIRTFFPCGSDNLSGLVAVRDCQQQPAGAIEMRQLHDLFIGGIAEHRADPALA